MLDVGILLLSSALAFSLGLTTFYLQGSITATAVSVANVAYKVVSILISFLLQRSISSGLGFAGLLMNLAGVLWFSITRQQPAAKA